MSKISDNQAKISQILNTYGHLTVSDAVRLLELSAATIRRLFASMEAAGLVIRTHGGIRPLPEGNGAYSFGREASRNIAVKNAIALQAAMHIRSGDRIFLDSGTTVRAAGDAIIARCRQGELTDIEIVTNSLAGGEDWAQYATVHLTGGTIRPQRRDLAGSGTIDFLRCYRFSAALLGTDGISRSGELLTTDPESAAIAATILDRCQRSWILADGEKFGREGFAVYGKLNEVAATIITDSIIDQEYRQMLMTSGAQVEYITRH